MKAIGGLSMAQGNEARRAINGAWLVIHGPWRIVQDNRRAINGAWLVIQGAWIMGLWSSF
jgi:hypothetical protein